MSTPPRPAGGILSKRSAWVASLYVVAILLLGSAVAITFGGSSRRLAEGLVPLKRQPLTAGGIRASFLAVWDEPHEVMVTLPTQSGLPEVDAFVASAAAHIGYYRDCPPFDLRWRAYENGVLIGSGSGARGAQGAEHGDLYRGFTFGSFPVRAGHTYEVEVDVGPGFRYLLPAAPSVEVGVATATASVGLALGDGLRKPVAWAVGTAGLVVLAGALWCQHSRSAAEQ